MDTYDVVQLCATAFLTVFGGAAFWGYWKDRRKSNAEGAVAAATVEIQIEASRVANLEQRFGFAQRAWDDERASLHRQIDGLGRDLAVERAERVDERARFAAEIAECRAELAEIRATGTAG